MTTVIKERGNLKFQERRKEDHVTSNTSEWKKPPRATKFSDGYFPAEISQRMKWICARAQRKEFSRRNKKHVDRAQRNQSRPLYLRNLVSLSVTKYTKAIILLTGDSPGLTIRSDMTGFQVAKYDTIKENTIVYVCVCMCVVTTFLEGYDIFTSMNQRTHPIMKAWKENSYNKDI